MTQSTQAAERSFHEAPAAAQTCHICAGPLRNGGAAVQLVPGTNAEGRTAPVMACVCSAECAADPRWSDPWGALARERDEARADNARLRQEMRKVIAEREEARKVLRGYEDWEADLILDNAAWRGDLPTLTERHYDALIQLQTPRNATLAAPAGGETSDAG